MSSAHQILSILLGAVPYLIVLIWILAAKRWHEISLSSILLGLFGIAIAVALGGIAGLLLILYNPHTASSLNSSFLIGVLAASVGVAMVAGEMFRYYIVRRSLAAQRQEHLVSLAYGIGFSLGEFFVFVVPLVMHWGKLAAWDASVMIAVDISIQIMVSIAAYELIRQGNFAFIAVGGLYYFSFFMSYVLYDAVILKIAMKVIVFGIALALMIVFHPTKKESENGERI